MSDSNSKRSQMTSLVFSSRNLAELKNGMCSLLDAFDGILEIEEEIQQSLSHEMIQKRLKAVESEKWRKIREKYLKDIGNSVEVGEEIPDPARLLLGFYNKLDSLEQSVLKTLAEKKREETRSSDEVNELREQLLAKINETTELRRSLEKTVSEVNSLKGRNMALDQQLKEKQDLIAQLQRNGTIQLWEMERTKLLDSVARRERELESELKELKIEHENTKNRLQQKIRDLDEQLKRKQLEVKLKTKSTHSEIGEELESTRRQLFMKEKSLLHAEQELYKQQKLYLGCSRGLSTDFKILASRLDKDMKLSRNDLDNFADILNTIAVGAKEGKLEIMKADLPEHYIALDGDMGAHPLGKQLSPIYLNKDLQSIYTRRLEPIQSNKPRSSPLDQKKVDAIGKKNEDKKNDHPELIDLETRRLKIMLAAESFPEFAEDQIKEHFDSFKKYDTSGDLKLDIMEITRAMQATIGDYYNAIEIKQAMLEVDVDSSNEIDFYEYLTIAQMLMRKAGKSAVFKSNLVKNAGHTISHTCVVQ